MAEVVEAAVRKWGKGLAIRLTQRAAKAGGLHEGSQVVIKAEPGRLVVEAKERRPTLDGLLARFDPERHGGEAMAALPPLGTKVL